MELRVCPTCTAVRPGATLCPGCQGPLRLADAGFFLGETFGNYHIDAVLGAGGMGVVYHATHRSLLRPAALKVVVPRSAEPGFERRFLREARVLAELHHAHIVEIYDFDVNRWGLPYYVMEHLGGAPLRLLIDLSRAGLAPPIVAALLADLAAGLTFAHRKGVVHRDLKPDNVFVARSDGQATVKLLDFGIAKLLADDAEETGTLTATGALLGTPHYVAPEQASGAEVSPATDQYALALMVAELFVGRPLRAGKSLMQILADDVRRPLDPRQLDGSASQAAVAALVRATEPDPAARFPDVTRFVAALELPPPDRAGLLALLPAPQPVAAPALTGRSTVEVTREHAAGPATTRVDAPTSAAMTEAQAPGITSALASAGPDLTRAPAAPRGKRRTRAIGMSAAALGLSLLVLAWLGTRRPAPPPPTATAPDSAPTLALRHLWMAPPDATRLLVHRDDTLVMAGGGALYLQPTRTPPAPAPANATPGAGPTPLRIALAAGQEVLGPTRDGGIFMLDGERVLRFDPLQQKSMPWIEHLRRSASRAPAEPGHEAFGQVVVSPSGFYVAQVEAGRIRVCARPSSQPACIPAFEVAFDASVALRLALSDRYLAVAQGQRSLDVYRTAGGARVRHTPLPDARVRDVALLDDAGLLAVAGWYPHVDVFAIEGVAGATRLPRQGSVVRLAWLGDAPTLLAGGPAGLQLWRPGGALQDVRDSGLRGLASEGLGLGDLLVAPDLVAALNGDDHTLALYDYDGLRAERRALSHTGGAVWALAAAPDGRHLYAGSSRGALHAYDVARDTNTTLDVHADGITDLVLHGGTLASASDDKTVAIWRLPGLEVLWRGRAHDFLVNQLALAGPPTAMWTSSSDGRVKRWGWPQPEELESLDVRTLVGGDKWALHALWVAPAGDLVLAGTWQHVLLELRRDARGAWSGRRLPVESRTLYRAIDVPSVEAVVLVGLSPNLVWAYDRRNARLSRLPSLGHLVNSGSAGAAPGEVYVAGQDGVLRYRLRRAADGGLDGDFTAALDTRLGVAVSAAWLREPGTPGRLVLGTNNDDTLLFVDPRVLERYRPLPLRPGTASTTTAPRR